MPPASRIEHYENFPVASVLLPRRLRRPVEVIYAFARSADDIADEGDASPGDRLAALAEYQTQLAMIRAGVEPREELFGPLARIIREHALPVQLFEDLLDAFSQDVVKSRYATYVELQDYARRSANPIGRLLLHLYGKAQSPHLEHADAICSALQFINFWQDIAVDWKKGRVYLPQEDLLRFGVTERHLEQQTVDDRFRALLAFQIDRSRALLRSGYALPFAMGGRIGLELQMVARGGARILNNIESVGYDVFHQRPTLGPLDWLRMLAASLFRRPLP